MLTQLLKNKAKEKRAVKGKSMRFVLVKLLRTGKIIPAVVFCPKFSHYAT